MKQKNNSTPIQEEYHDIKQFLDTLPTVTLPDSLSVASMWEKFDEAASTPNRKNVKVVQFVKKYRQALSYAAVFIFIVVVYYSMGVDTPQNFTSMERAEMSPEVTMDVPEAIVGMPQMMTAPESVTNDTEENGKEDVEKRGLQPDFDRNTFFTAEFPEREPTVSNDDLVFYKTVSANAKSATSEHLTAGNANFAKKIELYEDGTEHDFGDTKGNQKVLSYDRQDGDGDVVLLYEDGLSVGSIIMPSYNVLDIYTVQDNVLVTINQLEGNVDNYSQVCRETVVAENAGQPIDSRCSSAVAITVYDISERTAPQLIQQYIQEGSYVTHRRHGDSVLLASYKPIEGYTYMGEVAPMATLAGQQKMSQIPSKDVHVYPDLDTNEYLLLTQVIPSSVGIESSTAAVLGNNMKVQLPIAKTAFVLALNAPSSAKALDTFELGSVTFELR